jgi:hypothetical protein
MMIRNRRFWPTVATNRRPQLTHCGPSRLRDADIGGLHAAARVYVRPDDDPRLKLHRTDEADLFRRITEFHRSRVRATIVGWRCRAPLRF